MARLSVTYKDGSGDVVALGPFAQIAAKRRFGLAAVKSEDPEVALFGVFVELRGPQAAKVPEPVKLANGSTIDPVDPFDEWLLTIADFGVVGEEDEAEDPPAAESSDSSPESPPTSE